MRYARQLDLFESLMFSVFFFPLTEVALLIQLHRESILVKPVNTPITPLCSKSCVSMALRWIDVSRRKMMS